jgi:hypothetical protein
MKYCPACRASNGDTATFCSNCGAALASAPITAPSAGAPKTSGTAIASMIFGFFFFFFPAAVTAVILGHISDSKIRKSAGRLKGTGISLAGMILGYAGIILFPFLLITTFVYIGFNRVRHMPPANKDTAVRGLLAISKASSEYFERYQGYPSSLLDLGPPPNGQAPSPSAAGLLDPDFASGQKDGYVFSYGPLRPRSNGRFNAYNAEADPVYAWTAGALHFHVDESGILRVERSEVAGRTSPQLDGVVRVEPSPPR